MAIYSLSAKVISASKGQSATAASAYRAGEKITCTMTGETHDYTRKSGVTHTEIIAPTDAPKWVHDREFLWNISQQKDNRKNSQYAREIMVALPNELNPTEQIELVRDYVRNNIVSLGMVADVAIHDTGDGNPHAHILMTMRNLEPDEFGQKNRKWNKPDILQGWRVGWQDTTNRHLELAGSDARIDHRTLDAQGSELIPQIHHGNNPDRKERNQLVIAENSIIEVLLAELREIGEKIKALIGQNAPQSDLQLNPDWEPLTGGVNLETSPESDSGTLNPNYNPDRHGVSLDDEPEIPPPSKPGISL